MSSILTNNSAMVALQTLRGINDNLAKTQDMISTGKRVSSAKDNAAVFAISKVMESDVAGFKALSESLSLGASTVAVASNATDQIGGLLEEIKGKIVAANEDNVDRSVLQDEIGRLRDQITGVVGAAQFNGENLLTSDDTTSILASLDRASSGAVTSNSIEVNGRDFGTAAGTAGTDPGGKNASLSGSGVTGNSSTIQLTSAGTFLTGNSTESYTLTVADVDLTVSADDVAEEGIVAAGTNVSDEDLNTYLARAINNELQDSSRNLGMQGVTAVVQPNTGTPANSELVITSTASEAISIATDGAANAAGGEAAGPTSASLAAVTGEINARATMEIDLSDGAGTDSYADGTGDTFSITVGEDTFTYTAAGDDGDTNTTVGNIVTQFNQDLDDQGITGFRFEQADGGAAGSIVRVVNLDTTQGYDVSFSESGFSDTGTATQNAPTVDAATAASTSIDISGNVVEGDSFSVTLGSDTVTYVAGANESANDVIRGLQNVIAADGPAGVTTALNFAGDPSSGTASISLSAEAGFQVSVAEARGGTESTGDLYGLSGIDVTTADGAEKALGTIENLIQTNVDAQAEFGAAERRVELQQDFMSSLIDSFKSGIGSLVDTDMEEASARLQALQVQQQLGTQALSIANQAPQSILSLFR